jgi:hypothetical protein
MFALAPLAEHEVTHYNQNGPLGDFQKALAESVAPEGVSEGVGQPAAGAASQPAAGAASQPAAAGEQAAASLPAAWRMRMRKEVVDLACAEARACPSPSHACVLAQRPSDHP